MMGTQAEQAMSRGHFLAGILESAMSMSPTSTPEDETLNTSDLLTAWLLCLSREYVSIWVAASD